MALGRVKLTTQQKKLVYQRVLCDKKTVFRIAWGMALLFSCLILVIFSPLFFYFLVTALLCGSTRYTYEIDEKLERIKRYHPLHINGRDDFSRESADGKTPQFTKMQFAPA